MSIRRGYRIIIVLLALVALSALAGTTLAQDATPAPQFDVAALQAVAARDGSVPVIVGLKTGDLSRMSDISATQAIQNASGQLLSSLQRQGLTVNNVQQYESFSMIALEVDSAALNALAASPLVEYIEQDDLVYPQLVDSAVQVGASTVNGVWDRGFTGKNWVVAVIDSGVQNNHQSLLAKSVAEYCWGVNAPVQSLASLCRDGKTYDFGGNSALDCPTSIAGCGHGSHIAGIIASKHVTNRGIAPDAKILALKAFSMGIGPRCAEIDRPSPCAVARQSSTIAALDKVYQLRNTFKIAAVNMSFGSKPWASQAACNANNPGYFSAVAKLNQVNIAVVAGAGNDKSANGLSSPACVTGVISVGAVNSSDQVADFSNSASYLSLLAPGVSIESVDSSTSQYFTTKSGTSMAAPHVAAAFAILRQASPNSSVNTLLNTLQQTGYAVTDSKSQITTKRIRIANALDTFVPPASPKQVKAITQSTNFIMVEWQAVPRNSGYRIDIYDNGQWTTVAQPAADKTSHIVNNLKCSGSYKFRVYAKNNVGLSQPGTATLSTSKCPAIQNVQTETQQPGPDFGYAIKIRWDKLNQVDAYRVEYSPNGVNNWTVHMQTTLTVIYHSQLACGQTIYYRVFGIGRDFLGEPSQVTSGTTQACVGAPQNVSAEALDHASIQVSWDAVNNAVSYTVEKSPTGSGSWTTAAQGLTSTNWTANNLQCNIKYYYRVFSVSGAQTASPKSSIVSAQTHTCPDNVLPTAPQGVIAQVTGPQTVRVSWLAGQYATGYTVQRSLNNVNWMTMAVVESKQLEALDNAVQCGQKWYYRVFATNDAGQSPNSNVVSVMTPACSLITPRPENMLYNGDFEINEDETPRIPDGWTKKGPLQGDRLVTNSDEAQTAFSGTNAFMFKGNSGEQSAIRQNVNLDGMTFAAGDTLMLSAFVNQQTARPNSVIAQAVIHYSNGSVQRIKLRVPQVVASEYVLMSISKPLNRGDVSKIVVQVLYNKGKGKFYIDNVRLTHHAGSPASMEGITPLAMEPTPETLEIAEDGWLPLPALPDDMNTIGAQQ